MRSSAATSHRRCGRSSCACWARADAGAPRRALGRDTSALSLTRWRRAVARWTARVVILFTMSNSPVSFVPARFASGFFFLAERREAYSLRNVARVRRDATLARHGPLPVQPEGPPLGAPPWRVGRFPPFRSRHCRRVRREGHSPLFCPAAVAGLPSRLRAATTPHPAPPSGSFPDDAPHERDLRL